jgi:hypothetical protein
MSDAQAEPESEEVDPELVDLAIRIARAKNWARYSGWAILAAAIAQLPVLILPLMLIAVDPAKALLLSALCIGPLLSLAAAIGLIRLRVWGFHLIYLLQVIGFWTVTPSQGAPNLIPFIKKFIGVKPELGIFIQLTNLLFAGFLAVVHVRYFHPPTSAVSRQSLGRALAILFIVAGGLTAWRYQYEKVDTRIASAAEIPAAHELFEILQPAGPMEIYYYNAVTIPHGGTLIATGKTTEERLLALVEDHALEPVPDNYKTKLHRLIGTFKLDVNRFPTDYADDDLHYTGRL